MKRFLPLLIILPLLLYWSCEEESEDCAGVTGGDNKCGCTNATAISYDSTATFDDGSCEDCADISGGDNICGCTDSTALNYDSLATYDDESCDTIPPYPVQLFDIHYYGASYNIVWSQNNDYDFYQYYLHESTSEDMSNKTLIHQTDIIADTIYIITEVDYYEKKYYQVTIEDSIGLQSVSNTNHSFIVFNKTFGAGCRECSGQQTSDGGYIIGGEIGYGILKKVDSFGNEEWSQTFSDADLRLFDVKEDEDGYIVCGMKWSGASNAPWDLWIVKTDLQGNQQWEKTFTGEVGGWATSIQQTTDGGYIVGGGTTANQISPNHKIWIIKTDGEGNEAWSRTIEQNSCWVNSISQTTDGGFITVGENDIGLILIKLGDSGSTEWIQIFDDGPSATGNSVKELSDGSFIIAGHTDGFDGWLIKADSQGNEQWSRTIGGDMSDKFESLEETIDNGIIMVGRTFSYGSGQDDVWLVRTDSQGYTLWTKSFGGSGEDGGYSVMQTQDDDGYIITGHTTSYGSGSQDIWLIKTDSEGNTVPYGE